MRAHSIKAPVGTYLSFDEIGRVPSVLATTHDGLRSNRYTFLNSREVIESMGDNNWGVVSVKTNGTRKRDPNHARHQVIFLNWDISIQDPRNADKPLFPELIFDNSSNGGSAAYFLAGIYALVCTNGLVISKEDFGFFRHPHIKFTDSDAKKLIDLLLGNIDTYQYLVDHMSRRELTFDEKQAFINEALAIRYTDPTSMDYRNFSVPQRDEDNGNDLWTVFNKVQEYLVNGGVGYRRHNRNMTTRPMNDINKSTTVNTQLWNLARLFLET